MCLLLFFREADYSLKPISKEEAFALRKEFPDLTVPRTERQRSQRGHFFVEETKRVIDFLNDYWSKKITERWE